jgi:hypothetical protein
VRIESGDDDVAAGALHSVTFLQHRKSLPYAGCCSEKDVKFASAHV